MSSMCIRRKCKPAVATLCASRRIEAFSGPGRRRYRRTHFQRLGFQDAHARRMAGPSKFPAIASISVAKKICSKKSHGIMASTSFRRRCRWAGFGCSLPSETEERLLRNRLAAAGYSEIIPMAFSDEATERRFRPDVETRELINPMAEDEVDSADVSGSGYAPHDSVEFEPRHPRPAVVRTRQGLSPKGGERVRSSWRQPEPCVQEACTRPNAISIFTISKVTSKTSSTALTFSVPRIGEPLPAYYHPGRALRSATWRSSVNCIRTMRKSSSFAAGLHRGIRMWI